MRYLMFSVKDELTGKFMSPMYTEEGEEALAESLATRQFRTQMNSIDLWKNNPNDYSLYKVGIFDDENGAEACKVEKIVSGRSVLNG